MIGKKTSCASILILSNLNSIASWTNNFLANTRIPDGLSWQSLSDSVTRCNGFERVSLLVVVELLTPFLYLNVCMSSAVVYQGGE